MKTMHLSWVFMILGILAVAQPNKGEDRKKIEAMKVAYLTEQLNLSPAEAEKFWPVYNEFSKSTQQMRRNGMKSVFEPLREGKEMSKAESEELLNKYINHVKEMQSAELKLINDLRTVLPAAKIMKFRMAEEGFKQKMMDRLKGGDRRGRN